jgi:putative oligomerization/nucleic acid binding protein
MAASPLRRWLALGLVVVASVLAFVAVPAIWLNRQVLNTDNWTRTSSELLADPVIRAQVAGYLVDQLYANVDVEAELREALPPRLQPLAGPAAGGLRNLAERGANEVLSRPRAQEAWENANRAAQLGLLAVLRGGNQVASTQNGTVTLDLRTLLQEVADRVGVGGRLAGALPESAARITILQSNQLKVAQDVANGLKPLAIALVVLSLALFGVALAIAPGWRRPVVRAYGIGLVVAGGAVLVAIAQGGDAVVTSLATTAASEPAVRHAWDIGTPLLHEAAVATIGYGIVLILGAWLSGPSRAAVAIRRALAPYLREPLIAYSALALVMVLVIFKWAPTPATRNPVLAIVLVALVAAGFEALRRQAVRENPDADRHEALGRWRDRLSTGWQWTSERAATGARQASGAVQQGAATVRQASGDLGARTSGGDARLDELERLARLHDTGVLDDDEFRAEKARLLNGDAVG